MTDQRTKQPGDKYIVRFPEGMRDRIAEEAARSNRSMNAEIVSRLEASFNAEADRTKLEEQFAKLQEQHKDLLAEYTLFLEADKELESILKALATTYGVELVRMSFREMPDKQVEEIKAALSSKDESWMGKVISDAIHAMEAKLRGRKGLGV